MPATTVVKLPDAISETGAAIMLKGLRAHCLLRKTLPRGGWQPATSCCSTPRPAASA
jgi:NADPH2:quinone reductase